MISPGAAEVSYGLADTGVVDDTAVDVPAVLAEALSLPESDVRLFGRPDETDTRRRLGVALATAPDVTAARDRVRQVSAALRKLW
jgi:phosphoribosylglycinamide formyltransferase 2